MNGIDYSFGSDGVLGYAASIVAAVYTKDYNGGGLGNYEKQRDINTIADADAVAQILGGMYTIERYDNFQKDDFTSVGNQLGVANMNRGLFIYSGHCSANAENTGHRGLQLGNGEYLSSRELLQQDMNNTKVAFFFC